MLTKKHDSLRKVQSVAGDGCDVVVLGEKEKIVFHNVLNCPSCFPMVMVIAVVFQ